jgi:hypothetical protein
MTANQFSNASQYYLNTGKGSYHPLLDVLSFAKGERNHILLILFFTGGVVKEEEERLKKHQVRSSSNY